MCLLLVSAGCGVARGIDGRDCGSAAACVTVHPAGIADASSPDFHGALLRSNGWNLGLCQTCHGGDFAGGTSGKSCLTCHAGGPTACTVCHGQPPATGAHARHVPRFDCATCHPVPATWDAPGHLGATATVRFAGLAQAQAAPPSWDGARCSSTYCHGDARPAWNGGSGEASCGSCHRVPPYNHASNRCGDCHARVADSNPRIVDDSLHVDGKVSLGDDSGSCAACHPQLSAAHASHLQASHQLRAPLGCGECHVAPAALDSPGHIDHAPGAVVFPAGTSALARTDGAMPGFDTAGARCSDVYCHGGGRTLGGDAAATVMRAPAWAVGSGAAVCGGCHGVPPVDGAHTPAPALTDCARCHGRTMDATGALLRGGAHLDGVIDAS